MAKLKPLRWRLRYRAEMLLYRLVNACGICTNCYRRRHHGEYVCMHCYGELHEGEQ